MSNPDNPYLGLRPYTEQEQDRFFGRDAEIHILTDKILAHRLTLLVAASGVGKSSLLQAGVMPALRATSMADLVYHNDWAVNPDADLKTSLVKHLINKQRVTADYQADFTLPLAEFIRLHSLLCEGSLIILLDQFEEFFYYHRFSQQREPFIKELAGAIQDPQSASAFVFAMREDFAMELQAFKPWFKGIFDNVYRIEKLDLNAAKEAICKPLSNIGFSLEPELLEQLLQDLGQRELKERLELPQQSDRQTELFVEPPHLQIVCQQLWLQAQTDADRQIKLSHYEKLGKTQGILTGYFRQKMALLKREQLRLASKAFDHLVSQHGTKRSFPLAELAELLDENESALQQTLDLLQEAVILRRVQRNGSYWYELYHDIFAKSINDWNRDYKLRQLRWKAAKGAAYALAASLTLAVTLDGYRNYHNRYLQLGPETASDRVEVYQGEPGSWDLLHQQRFLYETDYVRRDIEADKRFQQQALAELEQTEITQIGQLPLDHRLTAFAKVGLFEKADQVSKALLNSKNGSLLKALTQQQHKIRTLSSFNTLDNLYREHSEMTDEMVDRLVVITPQAKRLSVIDELLNSLVDKNLDFFTFRDTYDIYINAIKVLSLSKPDSLSPKLLALLDDKNEIVRSSGAKASGRLNAQTAIPKLISLLDNKNEAVRRSAIDALDQLNAQTAISKLIALLDDNNETVLSFATETLSHLNAQTAIPKLIALLDNNNEVVRRSAIEALGQLNAQTATPKLIALLDDKNEFMRQSAAKALGQLNAQTAIPKLIALLDYDVGVVKYSAKEALDQLTSKATIPELIAKLNDKHNVMRLLAVNALAQLNAQTAISKLISLLDDKDNAVRRSTVEALAQLNAQEAIPKLVNLLDDKDDSVRLAAAEALAQLNSQTAIPKLVDLLDDQDGFMRRLAAEALAQLNAQAAIPKLVDLLDDQDNAVRQSAVNILGYLNAQATIPNLVALLDDKENSMRQSVARALALLNARMAIPKLIALLDDTNVDMRSSAAAALGQLNAQPAIPKLVALLDDKDDDIRQSAAQALALLNVQAAIPKLIALLDDQDGFVRDSTAQALALLNAQAAIPELAVLLHDKDNFVRGSTAQALGRLNAQAVIPKLASLLDDKDDFVRGSAAQALGQLNAQTVVQALLKLLTDKDHEVQQTAALALSRLHSQDPALAQWQDTRLAELNKTDANRKAKLADNLGYIVTPASASQLSNWLNDTDPNLVINSLNALATIATIQPQWLETHIPRLIELTRHEHFGIQQAAINTLAQLIAQQPNRSTTLSPSVAEQIRQTLTGLVQDNKLPDNLRLAALDGLGNSETEAAAAVLLTFSSDSRLQLRCLYWLAQMAYQPALPELKQGLAKLELEKQQWRQQVLDSKAQANETEALTKHEDKSWPNDYRVYQYAYAIARIDSQNAGIALLSHPLYAAREAAILALADQASGILATKLVADLQAFNPKDLPSPRPYAAYRALDLLLQQVEFSGNQDDLAALSKLAEVKLPIPAQQQAVNERLSWTVTELKARLDDQMVH